MTAQQISTATRAKAEKLADVLPFLHKGRSKRDGARFFICAEHFATLVEELGI